MDEHLNNKHSSVYSRFEGHELENHLHSEEHSEDQVQGVRQFGHMVRLVAVLFKVENKNINLKVLFIESLTLRNSADLLHQDCVVWFDKT